MTTFFIGFGCGILFIVILCVAIATAKPERIQRNTAKFFNDLKARGIRKRVKQINGIK